MNYIMEVSGFVTAVATVGMMVGFTLILVFQTKEY